MKNKLRFNKNSVTILCERTDSATHNLMEQIPYAHCNRIKTEYTTSIRNIDLALKLFRDIDVHDPVQLATLPKLIRDLATKEINRRVDTEALLNSGPVGETKFGEYTLMPHQQLGKEIADINDKYAFFYDTRTGKTPMSLAIIADDIKKNPHHKWLVLCPLILIENAWLEDSLEMFPELSVVNLHAGTKKKRLAQFAKEANLYISNTESFISYKDEIEKLNIHGCFLDESSTMKSNSSKFSHAAVDFANNLDRWYLLSGTPAPNGQQEYYKQLQSVDFYSVHQSYARFKTYFFDNKSYNPQFEKLVIKPERELELTNIIRPYALYVDKEDVLETPGRDFYEYPLTMPEELKAHYKTLKTEMYLEVSDGNMITSANAAASLNKLNQVTSGFAIDTQARYHNAALKANGYNEGFKEEVHVFSMYRFYALMELLEELGDEQAIIWCVYRKEFELIQELLGDRCGLIYGATNINQKNQTLKDFKSGKIQYLVANPASADKGLTLTNASIAIYFSLTYSYELWKQSIERIYGSIQKQPKRCSYYIFIAKGTVDAALYTAVNNKGDLSTAMLNHLKEGM